jgi:outer membrane biosynthesis protein TonB
MSSHLLTKNASSRSLNLNKSFLISTGIHLVLIFGITFSTYYKLPILNQTPVINVKLANANIDEIGQQSSTFNEVDKLDQDNLNSTVSKEQKSSYQSLKIKKLEANSLVTSAEAKYLNLWQRQIESAGDRIISENGIFLEGQRVQIIATIDSLGNLIRSEVVLSSGVVEVDLLAIKILNESAPFPAFDPLMIEEYGFIEIIRDWNFSSG